MGGGEEGFARGGEVVVVGLGSGEDGGRGGGGEFVGVVEEGSWWVVLAFDVRWGLSGEGCVGGWGILGRVNGASIQFAKAALDLSVRGILCDAQEGVVVPFAADLPVGFVEDID